MSGWILMWCDQRRGDCVVPPRAWSVARALRFAAAACLMLVGALPCWTLAQDVDESTIRARATVGSVGRIQDLVLSGSQLQAKPIEDRNLPLVVRVVETFPHGDAQRYELTFMALEPGRYDLREYLVRVDGSQVGELPQIEVEVMSVLAPGHVPPHQLVSSWPQVGSYRFWAMLAVAAWVVSLLAIILWPKRRPAEVLESAPPLTLAELLRPRLEAAAAGQLDHRQLAELERWVVEFWRRRLGMLQLAPKEALLQLRRHDESGPLLQQLERWLHSPQRDPAVSLGQLLQPYQTLTLAEGLEAGLPPAADSSPIAKTGGAA